ncbi:hypothetical protein [Paraburkholderia terrae]|uniref:hypothetical protein n=1 Tax=Paraburkholderia terrae TaxID=311230 RepID=UPI002066E268|nr:hypothetical protein [Paraburkholderia terrae]BDC39188.1 hypothetical protein PTKU15_24850 [Paraburkholderia terrae]
MDQLGEFERNLESLIGRPTSLRPFVCNGSPFDCEIFVVGLNPASSMKASFWDFWRPGVGFDKRAWFEAYKAERMSRPLKPGHTRRNPVSNSRRVIEWINASLGSARALETNIYPAATEEFRDLEQCQRFTAPFDFLLDTIKPAVIIVHGIDAVSHISQKGLSVPIIAVSHFSRGWSQRAATDLGLRVRAILGQ